MRPGGKTLLTQVVVFSLLLLRYAKSASIERPASSLRPCSTNADSKRSTYQDADEKRVAALLEIVASEPLIEEEGLLLKRSPPKLDLNLPPEEQVEQDFQSHRSAFEVYQSPIPRASEASPGFASSGSQTHPRPTAFQNAFLTSFPAQQHLASQASAHHPYHPPLFPPLQYYHLQGPVHDPTPDLASLYGGILQHPDVPTSSHHWQVFPGQGIAHQHDDPFNLDALGAHLHDPTQYFDMGTTSGSDYVTSSNSQSSYGSDPAGSGSYSQHQHQAGPSSSFIPNSVLLGFVDLSLSDQTPLPSVRISQRLLEQGYVDPRQGGKGLVLKNWSKLGRKDKTKYKKLGWVPQEILEISKERGKKIQEGRQRQKDAGDGIRLPRMYNRYNNFRAGKLNEEESKEYLHNQQVWGKKRLAMMNFWVPDDDCTTPREAATKAKEHINTLGLDMANPKVRKGMLRHVHKERNVQERYANQIHQQSCNMLRGWKKQEAKKAREAGQSGVVTDVAGTSEPTDGMPSSD